MANNVRIHTQVDGAGAAKTEIKSVKDAWTTFQKDGTKGLSIGAGAAIATGAFGLLDRAISVGIDAIGSSISAASDLNETMTKSAVIFGQNMDAVSAWADTMSIAGGQSKKAALDAASGFAGLFKTVGIGIDDSTKMSEKLTQMGSDLASFFNTDVGTALDALKSGLDGEAKPLRQFNIFLSETAVAAKLTQMGVKAVGGQFTEAQKATARYALIMEQTKDAQGDFARTSDGLANSQRILDSRIENLSARIGGVLLPVVNSAVQGMLGFADAVDKATDSSKPVEDRFKGLADILNTINPAMWANNAAMGEIAKRNKEVADAAAKTATAWDHGSSDITGSLQHADDSFNKLGKVAIGAADKVDQALGDVVARVRTTRDELGKLGSDTADVLFDPIIIKAQLAADQQEISAQRAIIANKHSTKQQVADAKQRLAELQKDAFEKEVALIGYGKMNAKDQKAFLDDLKKQWASSTGEAKADIAALIAYIEQIPTHRFIDFTVRGTNNTHGHAAGGPMAPYSTSLVGENGPEIVTMGASGGRVNPSAASMAAAWGAAPAPITVTVEAIHMHGVGSDVSAAQAKVFGQQVMDEVAWGLRRQSARRGQTAAVRP